MHIQNSKIREYIIYNRSQWNSLGLDSSKASCFQRPRTHPQAYNLQIEIYVFRTCKFETYHIARNMIPYEFGRFFSIQQILPHNWGERFVAMFPILPGTMIHLQGKKTWFAPSWLAVWLLRAATRKRRVGKLRQERQIWSTFQTERPKNHRYGLRLFEDSGLSASWPRDYMLLCKRYLQ